MLTATIAPSGVCERELILVRPSICRRSLSLSFCLSFLSSTLIDLRNYEQHRLAQGYRIDFNLKQILLKRCCSPQHSRCWSHVLLRRLKNWWQHGHRHTCLSISMHMNLCVRARLIWECMMLVHLQFLHWWSYVCDPYLLSANFCFWALKWQHRRYLIKQHHTDLHWKLFY